MSPVSGILVSRPVNADNGKAAVLAAEAVTKTTSIKIISAKYQQMDDTHSAIECLQLSNNKSLVSLSAVTLAIFSLEAFEHFWVNVPKAPLIRTIYMCTFSGSIFPEWIKPSWKFEHNVKQISTD